MSKTNAASASVYDEDLKFYDGAPSLDANAASTANVSFMRPARKGDDRLNAITARRAGRLNAASIKEDEVERLFAERAAFLNKKFSSGLTRSEERRLALVRWNLDRIQDARHGEALDNLEAAVTLYESLGEEISHLMSELKRVAPHGDRR